MYILYNAYIYIYIYIERERERERESGQRTHQISHNDHPLGNATENPLDISNNIPLDK